MTTIPALPFTGNQLRNTLTALDQAITEVGQTPGPPGEDGREIELQVTATHVQWRYAGTPTWTNLVPLSAITGPAGTNGTNGTNGQNLELRTTATHVQWRVVGSATWTDLVALALITGPAGTNGVNGVNGVNGSNGREVQLQTSSTHVQWRYAGDTTWTNLVALSVITGPAGQNIELQTSQTHIQWRVVGATSWTNLASLASLTGPQGPAGVVNAQAPLSYNSGTQTLSWAGPGITFDASGVVTYLQLALGWATGAAARAIAILVDGSLRFRDLDNNIHRVLTDRGNLQFLADTAAARSNLNLGTTDAPRFARLGLGVEAPANLVLAVGGAVVQLRQSVVISGSTYTLDVTTSNEFVTSAAIAGAVTINLSNLASIPNGYIWRGVLRFAYTSGTITWFSGNTGYAVKWDGGSAVALTASDQEAVIVEVVGGSTIIEVASMRGRA